MLRKWNPNNPPFKKDKPFSALVLASRGSGKSHLIKYLLEYHLRDKFDSFYVISESYDELDEYKEILPGTNFFSEFDEDLITNIFEVNKRRHEEGKAPIKTLLVMDDKISMKLKHSDDLLQVYTRGRHQGVSIIFISQSHVFASPAWRSNSDLIFLLRMNSPQARDAVVENMLRGTVDIPEGDNEKKFYRQLMRRYVNEVGDSLVIDYRQGGFNNLFWYRAPSEEKLKAGRKALSNEVPKPVPKPTVIVDIPPPPEDEGDSSDDDGCVIM